ncbi:LacI family DNA-binding transcriptional regulator [Escherichia coli]
MSVSTVSLVLVARRISTATGERVNAAIEELGFVRIARRRRCAAGKAASLV